MYKFSQKSLENLKGIHPDLLLVVHSAMDMQVMDFSVVEGLRTAKRQKYLVETGKSKTMNSKHLKQNDGFGHAVDLYPYPINMEAVHIRDSREISRFGILAGIMLSCAKMHNITITSGMDWDRDGEVLDHTFFDAPHYQLERFND